MKYWILRYSETATSGVARPLGRSRDDNWPFIERFLDGGWIEGWPDPMKFTIDDATEVLDYQSDVGGFRLCSKRLRRTFDSLAGSQDVLQWLPAVVTLTHTGESHSYSALHIPVVPDVLSSETTRAPHGVIIRAVGARRKIVGHEILPRLDGTPGSLTVSNRVKETLESQAITGCGFEPEIVSAQ